MVALDEAIKYTNIGSGTISEPIRIDNFVSSYENKLPEITYNTKVKASFGANNRNPNEDNQIICCKIKNVSKSSEGPTKWKNIFDCDPNLTYSAPDGGLYILPDTSDLLDVSCHITTKPKEKWLEENVFISYSILFCLSIENKPYYFNFDPLAKISSNPPVDLGL